MDCIATLTKRTIEVSPTEQQCRSILTGVPKKKKKKDSGGRMHQPLAKVRQAMHDHEETVQRCDAKVQKEREHHHHCMLMDEGSKNEDKENSNEERGIEEDNVDEDKDGGSQVGRLNVLCVPLRQKIISSLEASLSPQSLVQCLGSASLTAPAKYPGWLPAIFLTSTLK